MPFEALVDHIRNHERIIVVGSAAKDYPADKEAKLHINLNISKANPTDLTELQTKLLALTKDKKLPVLGVKDNLARPKNDEVQIEIACRRDQLSALRFKSALLSGS